MSRTLRWLPLAAALVVAPHVAGTASAGAGDDLDDARDGLAAFLAEHRPASPSAGVELDGCPAIDRGRFQRAVDDAFGDAAEPPGAIGDWGTEIEWDEWQDVDADLMAMVCGGDADGDTDDTDTLLGARITVVDAGSDERALAVEQQIGFGVLDPEPADVPGGEVMSACLDDGSLSLCVSVWSDDGFLVAVVLRSDQLDIPDGAGTAVLEDVLGDVASTLAAYQPGAPPVGDPPGTADQPAADQPAADQPAGDPGAGAGLDTAAATTGLASRLLGMAEISDAAPLEDCPVVGRDAVVDALAVAGVDTPIDALLAEQGPSLTNGTTWHATGVVCTGRYVGAEDDESFPELRISVVVADFGDTETFMAFVAEAHPGLDHDDELATPTVGGATVGECARVDRTDQCAEYWEDDGFVVGVQVADRVFMDRPTASATVVALVPVIVGTLGAEPVVAPEAGVDVPPDVVEAARAQVAALASGPEPAECAFVDQPAIDAALATAGVDLITDYWTAVAFENASGAIAGVACAGDAGGGQVHVSVVDFGRSDAARHVIELVHGCQRVGDTEYCVETWEQDGLTVTVAATAVGADLRQPDVRALVDALAPAVLGELGVS